MSRKNKTYTEEFKKTLVDLLTNGKSIAEVSREYGVATSNLVGWKNYIQNFLLNQMKQLLLQNTRK